MVVYEETTKELLYELNAEKTILLGRLFPMKI
jgi:hypothetical protein